MKSSVIIIVFLILILVSAQVHMDLIITSVDCDTTFYDTLTDPEGTTIDYLCGEEDTNNDCPKCYLLVKADNQDPAYYLSDLGKCDGGKETVNLAGF